MFDDWMDRYQYIIELGRKLPPFPRPGWTTRTVCPDAERSLDGSGEARWKPVFRRHLRCGDRLRPDRTVAACLFGRSPAEIASTDPIFLKQLGLLEALSTNRGNGIAAMARKVREVAALQQAA